MEVWKPIPGYEEYYEASTLGRIRSKDRFIPCPKSKTGVAPKKGRILRPSYTRDGYPQLSLIVDTKRKTHKVHRLIAITFIPNPDNLPEVDHINGIKYDNQPKNLRWCTKQKNCEWRSERKRKKVLCKETGMVFRTSYEAAEWIIRNKIKPRGKPFTTNYKNVARNIRMACLGNRPYAHTFHWTYLEGSTTISKESREKSRNGGTRVRRDKI